MKERKGDENVQGSSAAFVAEFASSLEQNLVVLLSKEVVIRDIERQWKHHEEAVLPLLALGSEEDPNSLWKLVVKRTFSADDPEDIRMLESVLDAVSACMLEAVEARVAVGYPNLKLLEGYWCIYALLLRSACVLPSKPIQRPLFLE